MSTAASHAEALCAKADAIIWQRQCV